MKLLAVFIILAGPLIIFSLSLDLLQGDDVHTSIRNAFSPFQVMETPELMVLLLFILLLAADFIKTFYQKRQPKG